MQIVVTSILMHLYVIFFLIISVSFLSLIIISLGKDACLGTFMPPEGMPQQRSWYKSMRAGGCQDARL